MLTLGNSIDYLSIQGLPWIVAAWIGLIIFRPFATFVHEVGHIIPALILTNKEVYIRIGQSGSKWKGRLYNIIWEFSFTNAKEGFSGYDKTSLSKLSLITVISGGLCSSLTMTFFTGLQIFSSEVSFKIFSKTPIWLEVILVSWFCANALIFLRSIVPLRLKPTTAFPEGPPSDGLELIGILLSKKN